MECRGRFKTVLTKWAQGKPFQAIMYKKLIIMITNERSHDEMTQIVLRMHEESLIRIIQMG